MAQTLFDKLWDQHCIADLPDGTSLIAIDRIFLHERTGSIALKGLEEKKRSILRPASVYCTIDHIVDTFDDRGDDTLMPSGRDFITATREAAHSAGLTLFDVNDPEQGIVHVISPELGIAQPGLTIICPDSHTCTQGALGALAWGIGSTEAEHALATSTLRLRKPSALKVKITGTPAADVTAKDIALHLIATHGADGGKAMVVEFCGSVVDALPIEGRMTLCNMAAEFGAFSALVAPDEATIDYVRGRRYAPRDALWDEAIEHWRSLKSDTGAAFDREIELDVSRLGPMVSWGTSPQQSVPLGQPIPEISIDHTSRNSLSYMDLKPGMQLDDLAIDGAFIGSCTNARLTDLRAAAAILKGRRVRDGVKAICVPGSMTVRYAAEAEGLDQVFRDAGFQWRKSGCSMCFFAGGESFGEGARVISSTNRNFENRQGPGTRTHLASPAVVAASAIAGAITRPDKLR